MKHGREDEAEKITKIVTGNYDYNGMTLYNNGDEGELLAQCNRILRREFHYMWLGGYRIVFTWGMYGAAQTYKPYEYAGNRWVKWPELK